MAEFVIGPLVSMVKEKASSYLLDQYKVMNGMEEQREILERKLPAILDVIEDAEKGASRPGVSAWLEAVKTVSYQAIDVFDEFKYEALRRDAKEKGHYVKLGFDVVSIFPSHNPILFRYRMGKKLCRIVKTIEILVAEMSAFVFLQRQQAPPSSQWRQTDSIMVDSEKDIVSRSRDEEKTKIVKVLLDQASERDDLMVLPIVGLGGLGKTTFAQLIYNDPEIKEYFQLQRWCCISDDFDVTKIASNICQTNEKDREKALQNLQKEVTGKRYLIVLDDVWNRDADKWEKLKTCLKQGDKGSAILTTTRDAEVGRVMAMGTVGAHNLGNLDKVFLKEIIEKRAFSLQKPNSDELDGIVDKIVDRCAGSPLAAKAFGSLLNTKNSMQEWKDVLTKSNICNEKTGILPILKLSYDDLPSQMKQCFAFCAIFPKDYEIGVETLIQLWMAHDFIPPQEDDHLEKAGEEIFKELTWRSFFQDVKQTPVLDYSGKRKQLRCRTVCKIHDLMHDIALSVMGNECITIVDSANKKLSGPTRHLFSSCGQLGTLFDDFLRKQSPNVQILLYTNDYTRGSATHLAKCNSLRALQLFVLKELPLRPRHLQHLRYLNLANNGGIIELPDEISILYNLQTLNLSHCWKLVRLPEDMKYMTSLRHLYTNGCTSLKCMPPDLGQLTSLQTLTCFVVGASPGCSTVRELQNLNLGGELQLYALENVTEEDAKAASLRNKEKLTHLALKWSDDSHVEHKKVLDALKPHGGLKMLKISSYKSAMLPTWMADLSVLQHLTELYLVDFTTCEEFPQFGRLGVLEVLHLKRLNKLQSLCIDTSAAFPSLKELRLDHLDSLERWVATEGREEPSFHQLEKVTIKYCPRLTTLPEAPKLEDVVLKEHKAQLSLSILRSNYMSVLTKLELHVLDTEPTPTLQLDQDHEASVSEMTLYGCDLFFSSNPSQPAVGIWKCFAQLVDLRIMSCKALIYWPEEEFRSLFSVKKLSISWCGNLIGLKQEKGEPNQARDQLLPHLISLTIRCCESLQELFVLPPCLTSMDISHCENLDCIFGKEDKESESVESVQVEHHDTLNSSEHSSDLASTSMPEQPPSPRNNSLPCLENLYMWGLSKLVALPYLPPSLKKLFITSCDQLRSVSGQLDALENLRIYGCNMLVSVDYLGDLPSLESLELMTCKRLASLPGCSGSYSVLRRLTIKYCPAINMKTLYKHIGQRLDSLEYKNLSHARSRDPYEGTIQFPFLLSCFLFLCPIWYRSIPCGLHSGILCTFFSDRNDSGRLIMYESLVHNKFVDILALFSSAF